MVKKCTVLVSDVDNGEDYAHVEAGDMLGISASLSILF